jgi:hypothetical protein
VRDPPPPGEGEIKIRSRGAFFFVTTGHSCSKNGVASLAYDPVVHAEPTLDKPHRQSCCTSGWIAGSFDVKTALRAFCRQ